MTERGIENGREIVKNHFHAINRPRPTPLIERTRAKADRRIRTHCMSSLKEKQALRCKSGPVQEEERKWKDLPEGDYFPVRDFTDVLLRQRRLCGFLKDLERFRDSGRVGVSWRWRRELLEGRVRIYR